MTRVLLQRLVLIVLFAAPVLSPCWFIGCSRSANGPKVIRFDKPLSPREVSTPALPTIFEASEPYVRLSPSDENTGSLIRSVSPNEVIRVQEPVTISDSASWSVPRDQPRFTYPMPTDFKLAVGAGENTRFAASILAADLNGPFVMVGPDYNTIGQQPVKFVANNEGKLEIIEKPCPNFDVYDLRSGKPIGSFHWRVPMWGAPVLAPDGTHLVGPHYVPMTNLPESTAKEFASELQALYVWKMGEEKPKHKLPMADTILWMGFINRNEIAVLTSNGKQELLHFWNIETGKQRAAVEMPYESRSIGGNQTADAQRNICYTTVAVSPRGKQIAVLGNRKLVMVTAATAKVEGTTDVTNRNVINCGVRFSDDADTIAVYNFEASQASGTTNSVLYLSATEGKRMSQATLLGNLNGPVVWASPKVMLIGTHHNFAMQWGLLDNSSVVEKQPPLAILRLSDKGQALALFRQGERTYELQVCDRASILPAMSDDNSPYGPAGEPTVVAVEDRSMKTITRAEPTEWTPLVDIPAPKSQNCAYLPCDPWLARIGSETVGTLVQKVGPETPGGPAMTHQWSWQQFEANTGKALGAPIKLRRFRTNGQSESMYPFALSADDKRFAVADPEFPARLVVYNAGGSPVVSCEPFATPIDWLDFLADGRLLVCSEGELKLLEVEAGRASTIYTTKGYRIGAPYVLLPDRKQLAASRGLRLDIIDASTGQSVNSIGMEDVGLVGDIAISPDGKRLAVLYGRAKELVLRKTTGMTDKYTLVVYDMATGASTSHTFSSPSVLQIAWVGTDTICICRDHGSSLLDLKLNVTVANFFPDASKREHPTPEAALVGAMGGKIYQQDTSLASTLRLKPLHEQQDAVVTWKSVTLTGTRSETEQALLADDRELLEIRKQPIALVVDLGSRDAPSDYADQLAQSLAEKGFTVGAGGLLAQIKPAVVSTSDRILSAKTTSGVLDVIPMVEYRWKLEDSGGAAIFETKTEGRFDYKTSKYFKGSAATSEGAQLEFQFDSNDARKLIADEIIKNKTGFMVPEKLPEYAIRGGGKTLTIPADLSWTYEAVETTATQ